MIIIWVQPPKIFFEMYGITKDEQDKFATESQNKTENAQKNNYFDNEIIPVEIKSKKNNRI